MKATAQETLITPVILCGGSGTRLWPLSRDRAPKQFASLVDTLSTFQLTARRLSSSPLFARMIVIAGHDVRFLVAEQLQSLGLEADIVVEPAQRDTAPAIAVGTVMASRGDANANVLVVPADHVMGDDAAFSDACGRMLAAARQGFLMTLGVKPDHPATGYGYIAPGEPIDGTDAVRVRQFVEKPTAEAAARYIDEGFLWNSGCFLFKADVMRSELDRYAPEVLAFAENAVSNASRDLDFLRLNPAAFGRAPKISIDYAVMERTSRAGVLPATFPWSDVGSWDGVWRVLARDPDGNVQHGNTKLVETRNSFVYADDLLTAVVGLDDVVVVTTRDAVLVTARDVADHAVKELVSTLKAEGRSEVADHPRVHRPWGWYQSVDAGIRFQVKRICVKPGGQLSLQKHFHRAEHWIVVRGIAEVTVNGRISLIHQNEPAYIPIGATHRLCNPGKIPLEIIEVQVGSYTGEDDILRLEDAYERSLIL
jgi:mannose-1-phosphate guanylyltransferase / mannose-6-phosphate isomerase